MRLFGYSVEQRQGPTVGDIAPDALSEITLVATPDELRRIAMFLQSAAASMERMGPTYDHEHLADTDGSFVDAPQVVVARNA